MSYLAQCFKFVTTSHDHRIVLYYNKIQFKDCKFPLVKATIHFISNNLKSKSTTGCHRLQVAMAASRVCTFLSYLRIALQSGNQTAIQNQQSD